MEQCESLGAFGAAVIPVADNVAAFEAFITDAATAGFLPSITGLRYLAKLPALGGSGT